MKRLIREPLVHFLVLGAALFAGYSVLNHNSATPPDEIVITPGQIENLTATFTKVWQRPPTAEELKAQIDAYVKEEVLSREAIKLGLDQHDTVIRRRLEQKMEFIAEDFSSANAPTAAELSEYLARHPEKFREDARFTFRQIYLNPELHPQSMAQDAAELLADLVGHGADLDLAAHSDSTLLPAELVNEPKGVVSAQFGADFAAGIGAAKTGEWTGPIKSPYGSHLVFVSERTEPRVPEINAVREQVKRELMNERRVTANRNFLDALLQKYRVTIHWPESNPTSSAKATAMK